MHSLALRLIFLLLSCAPLVAEAQFEYTTSFAIVTNNGVITINGAVTITGYDGPGGTLTIPAELDGYPVTTIGNGAFEYNTGLTNVIVPDSVTSLGNDSFAYCSSLTNVSLGSGITNIGGNVFTFGGRSIPGDNAFFDCTNLIGIAVDPQNPVYSSTNGVMFDNQGTLIQFPPGLTGNYTISNGVTGIGFQAFATALLTGVTIPDSVTTISSNAFEDCGELNNLFIGNGVTNIPENAFEGCDDLSSVSIGSGVTNIVSTTIAYFGGHTVYTYNSLFATVPSLTNITVDAANPMLSSLNGVVFNKNQTTLVTVPCGLSGTYQIPDSVTVIGPLAFADCSNLTNVVLDSGITNIEAQAFAGCSDLTAIYFEGNAPSADATAFDSGPTIYYLPNAEGWPAIFNNLSTALWLPQIQAAGAIFGTPTNQFGFNISWASGQTVVVQACTDITNPVWQPIWTNTLASLTTNFIDSQWANYPSRFYRIESQ